MKKIFAMLLAGLVAFSAVSCNKGTGSGNNVKNDEIDNNDVNDVSVQEEDVRKVSVFAMTEEGDAFAVSADVFYPADADITEDEYASPYEAVFNNETLNYAMTITLCEDSFYESGKEYALEEETYSEFKVGKYNAFGYENYGGYYVNIHFEKVADETDRYMEIYVDVLDAENEYMEGIEFFEEDEIFGIINSVVYNGVVPYDIEEAGDEVQGQTALFLYGYDEIPFTIYKPECASFLSEPEAEGRDMISLLHNDNAWIMDIWGAIAFDYGEATDPFANYYFNGSLSEIESEYYEIESQDVKDLGISFEGKRVKRVETVIRDIEEDEVTTDVFVGFELESTIDGEKSGIGLVGFQLYMYKELPSDDELASLFCELFGV